MVDLHGHRGWRARAGLESIAAQPLLDRLDTHWTRSTGAGAVVVFDVLPKKLVPSTVELLFLHALKPKARAVTRVRVRSFFMFTFIFFLKDETNIDFII
jgi:hypothetical protein